MRVTPATRTGRQRKLYIESYGCQMNFSDSEIVSSILFDEGFDTTDDLADADLVLLNTCSIREKAEQTVRTRLKQINSHKKRKPGMLVGVLGCMAERLKSKFLEEEKLVDLVVGPDAYRDLPRLISEVDGGQKARERAAEPRGNLRRHHARAAELQRRHGLHQHHARLRQYVLVLRGALHPRPRAQPRRPQHRAGSARPVGRGYSEVTLLGQNVDSYKWASGRRHASTSTLPSCWSGWPCISPELRVRFSTSHPKDITDEVLHTMARHDNICKYIHLPAQSGNSRVLELMNRTYDRAWYVERVQPPSAASWATTAPSSTDMIAGFCSETEEEHQDTLSLMDAVQYDMAYMFFYSERPGTLAARKLADDMPLEVKKRRLQEIIDLQQGTAPARNARAVGKVHQVLIEGFSKRSAEHLSGRNSQNKVVIFPKQNFQKGEYVNVLVHERTAERCWARWLSF